MADGYFASRLLAYFLLDENEYEEIGLQSENPPNFSPGDGSIIAHSATCCLLTDCLADLSLWDRLDGEVAERSKAPTCKGWYALKGASEVRILPLSEFLR